MKEVLNEDGYGRKQGIRGYAQHVQHAHDLMPILVTNLKASEQIWKRHSIIFFFQTKLQYLLVSYRGDIIQSPQFMVEKEADRILEYINHTLTY